MAEGGPALTDRTRERGIPHGTTLGEMRSLLFFPLALLAGCADDPQVSPVKPNIVFILADDLGYGDVSSYNPERTARRVDGGVLTPTIDRLAEAGMRFTNAHTASAVCTPTRYAMLTGNHNVRIDKAGGVQTRYSDPWLTHDEYMLGDLLSDAGYSTHMVGKWHLGSVVRDRSDEIVTGSSADEGNLPDWTKPIEKGPGQRGFDYWYGFLQAVNNAPYKWMENARFLHPESMFVTQEEHFPHLDHTNAGGYADASTQGDLLWDPFLLTRMLQNKAVEVIREQTAAGQPYFLYIPLPSPHVPTCPHKAYQGVTPHEYTDFVAEVDGVVGAIVGALEESGTMDETLLVFTSDNGARVDKSIYDDHFGTGVIDGVELRDGKSSLYEAGHRVPYVARWDNRVKAGAVSAELLDVTDFMATVAAIVEQPIREGHGVDSVNMLPALTGDGSNLGLRELMINSSLRGHVSIRSIDDDGTEWKLLFSTSGGGGFGGAEPEGDRFDPMTPFDDESWSKVQLFNISADVGERDNLLAPDTIDEEAKAKAQGLQALYLSEMERASF